MQQLEDLERERTEEVSRLKGATLPPTSKTRHQKSVVFFSRGTRVVFFFWRAARLCREAPAEAAQRSGVEA